MKKILLIDDEVMITDPLTVLFKDNGWEVFVLHESTKALSEIGKIQPDIVVLDILMPIKSGIDVLKELSETAPKLIQHTIMLTSMDDDVYLARAMEYGVSTYIRKAETSLEQVLEKVEQKYKALRG